MVMHLLRKDSILIIVTELRGRVRVKVRVRRRGKHEKRWKGSGYDQGVLHRAISWYREQSMCKCESGGGDGGDDGRHFHEPVKRGIGGRRAYRKRE